MSNTKSKNATIIAASSNYLGELTALLNSIDYHKINTDVLLLAYKLPENYLKRIQEVFDFHVRIFQAPEGEQTKMTAIERFRIAVEYGKEYSAICLLDADMTFMSNLNLFWDIASKGFLIGAHNGMIISFGQAYQQRYHVNLGVKEYPAIKIHTTAPIWLSPQDLDWFDALYKSKRIDSFDDFLYLNILGIKMGKTDRMITFSPFKFTNIHHWSMKVETGMMRKVGDMGDLILTGTEEEVLMNHGKFSSEAYAKDLMTVMKGYLKNEGFTERHERRVLASREVMVEEFIKYAYLCKLDLRDFVKIDWLEEKLKTFDPNNK